MNIIFDNNLELSPEYRAAIEPVLAQGLSPLVLDSMAGLKGTPDEKAGFLFFTSLSIDILGYHGDFLRAHNHAPQWFFVLVGDDDHGASLLKDAAIKYNLNSYKIYHASDIDSLKSSISDIVSTTIKISGKVLICSKHKNTCHNLGQYLFGNDTGKYDCQIAGPDIKTDASVLIFCGREERDFKNVHLPQGMEPIFVVTDPERNVQQFLQPDRLFEILSNSFNMTVERVKARLYFISIKGENWRNEKVIGGDALSKGILMWDPFGLPLSRKEYTAEKIEAFISSHYTDCKHLKELLG